MESVWTVAYRAALRVSHGEGFRFAPKKPVEVARLILVLEGKLVVSASDKTFCVSEGEGIFLPQGLLTTAEYTEKENVTLVFRFEPISGPIPTSPTFYPKNDRVLSTAIPFAEKLRTDPNADGNYALSKFYRILSYLLDMEEVSKNKKRILPALRHIERNFTRQEKVETWAKMSFMSETAFRKLFREEMGLSPIDYRNRLRLQFAEEMRNEGVSAAAAAESAGFGSLSFYLRLRKKEKAKENMK